MQTKFDRESTNSKQGIIDLASLKIDFTRKLGEGGFGTVYRGKYRGKEVAVKQIQQNKLTPETEREFELEAKIMWQLKDPSVLHLYGITKDEPRYMVLEYCALGSLRDYLKKKPVEEVSWELRFHFSTGVASGLQYLHTYNPIIIHGDLKSLNVLLAGNPLHPDTKIADFGMAKLKAVSSSQKTLESASEGKSLVWAAPELFSKSSKKTTASDMYAFGMTLWEIASHLLPYHDQQEVFCGAPAFYGRLHKGENEDIPANTPALFAKVITDCWVQKPEDRPSAKTVLDELETYEQSNEEKTTEKRMVDNSVTVSKGLIESSSSKASNQGVVSQGALSSYTSANTSSNSSRNANSSPYNSGVSRVTSKEPLASSPLSSTSSSSNPTNVNSSPYNSSASRFSMSNKGSSSPLSSIKTSANSTSASPIYSRTSSQSSLVGSKEDKIKMGFFQAAKMGDQGKLSTYKDLLDEGLSTQDSDGNTALHYAAADGQLEMVRWLVKEEGMNASERNQAEETPLLVAAQNGKQAVVEWLVQSAEVDEGERNSEGASALLLAAQQGHLVLVAWLLETGVSKVTEKDKKQNTVFSSTKEAVVLWATLYRDLLQAPDPATSNSFDKIQAYQKGDIALLQFTAVKTLIHFGAKELLKLHQAKVKMWWPCFTTAERSTLSMLAISKQLQMFLPQSEIRQNSVQSSVANPHFASPLTSAVRRRSLPLSPLTSATTKVDSLSSLKTEVSSNATLSEKEIYMTEVQVYNSGEYLAAKEGFEILASKHNYPGAYLYLGLLYKDNVTEEISEDTEESGKWFQKVATNIDWFKKEVESGESDAQTNLAYCYQQGIGVEKNEETAKKYYQLAANQGHLRAKKELNALEGKAEYIKGIQLLKDCKISVARACFETAAGKNYPPAYLKLAISFDSYDNKDTIKKWKEKAALCSDWFEKEAKNGEPDAQMNLAHCYRNGIGVQKNEYTAVRYYKLAAEQGDTNGQLSLGAAYSLGQGLVSDQKEALKYFQMAADKGSEAGYVWLGLIDQNHTQAKRYFQMGAEKGSAISQLFLAQYYLGEYYKKEFKIYKDLTQALKYLRLAAAQGLGDAQYWLGRCYQKGWGVGKDLVQAVRCYQFAAKKDGIDTNNAEEKLTNLLKKHPKLKQVQATPNPNTQFFGSSNSSSSSTSGVSYSTPEKKF